MNQSEVLYFAGFIVFIASMLVIDLGVFNRKDHIVTTREALIWTCVWISLAMSFYVFLYFKGEQIHGLETAAQLKAYAAEYDYKINVDANNLEAGLQKYRSIFSLEFLTGYLIELSLSVDNIFIIIMIFASFKVEKLLYHRVLFWGIIGAVVFRCIFIFAGSFLISKFEWILFVFAGFLVYTGIKMMFSKEDEHAVDFEKHIVIRFASRIFKIHRKFEGNSFFIKTEKGRYVTPLFLVLLMIEFSDVLFAVDSIPAIFAITKDPYIVFFSNIFAVLGLRSMFFLLINVVDKFHFFKYGLAMLLIFIGLKMFFAERLEHWGFSTAHSLIVILTILFGSILLSFIIKDRRQHPVPK